MPTPPAVATIVVIFAIVEGRLQVLPVHRDVAPDAGRRAAPGGLWAGGGGIAGWPAARGDKGFKNERLGTVGEGLNPGTSAIIAVVEHKWVEQLEKELVEAGADVTTEALAQEIQDELNKEEEFAISVTTD